MFSLYYRKNNNSKLFGQLENTGFSSVQNYIPIYSEFFELNETNHSLINLNSKYSISSIKDTHDKTHFLIDVLDEDGSSSEKVAFFKFSPLLNPLSYLTGKYKQLNRESLLTPTINSVISKKDTHLKKIHDTNNTSYVDGFFSYLSSKLLNNHDFVFGNDYYGTFVGVQDKFNINVYDDLDYLHQSEFFHKNREELFTLEKFDMSLLEDDTRKYREKLNVEETTTENTLLLDEFDNESFDKVFELTTENVEKLTLMYKQNQTVELDLENNVVYEKIKRKDRSSSDLSSNTEDGSEIESDTDDSCSESDDEIDVGDDNSCLDDMNDGTIVENELDDSEGVVSCSNSEISEYSSSIDDNVNCVIYNFPIQMICMEEMNETLDDYIENNEMTNLEWKSCLLQVMFILITYQKCFDFTHNDLHTNNIMYITTPKEYIYIKYNSQYYKIPTFGKIFKIIDFGRAIYKYKGKLLCSDSYNFKEDASNQYNFGPYRNHNKPEILPNKSFDLCRLGCSLYDYFIDDFKNEDKQENEIVKLIIKWTRDDKTRNILYKKNGDERYRDFKLYKMIARTVHHCEPHNELKNQLFDEFKVSRKKVHKNEDVNNIDEIPVYV
jgi:hypothetical protein